MAAEEARDSGPVMHITSRLIIPVGLAISCLAHLAFLTPAVILGGGYPFDPAPVEAVTVDIVSPEEIEEAPKPEAAPPDTAPSFDAKMGAALPSAESALPDARPALPQPELPPPARAPEQGGTRQAAAQSLPDKPVRLPPAWPPQQVAPPPPEPAQPQESDITNMFAMPLALPGGRLGGKYDSQAVDRADISNDSAAAFRTHLKTCSALPAGVAPDVKVVLRVYLKPDGSLAAGFPQNPEPIKVEGVSIGGGALFQSAVAALRKCQPYKMLPPDRYEEWKRLDLTFTPQNF